MISSRIAPQSDAIRPILGRVLRWRSGLVQRMTAPHIIDFYLLILGCNARTVTYAESGERHGPEKRNPDWSQAELTGTNPPPLHISGISTGPSWMVGARGLLRPGRAHRGLAPFEPELHAERRDDPRGCDIVALVAHAEARPRRDHHDVAGRDVGHLVPDLDAQAPGEHPEHLFDGHVVRDARGLRRKLRLPRTQLMRPGQGSCVRVKFDSVHGELLRRGLLMNDHAAPIGQYS